MVTFAALQTEIFMRRTLQQCLQLATAVLFVSISTALAPTAGLAHTKIAAGPLAIAHSGFPDFARASLQGAPLKIIINDIVASPYAVFAKPGIKSIADLRGKLISIGGVKDVTLIYIKAFLASAALRPGDVDFVYAKAAGDRLSALISGGV